MKTAIYKDRLFKVLAILIEYTDSEHFISAKKIAELLSDKGIKDIDRKTIVYDIKALREAGFSITANTGSGYSIDAAPFIKAELKVISDLLSTLKNISDKDIKTLNSKLSPFLSIYDQKLLKDTHIQKEKHRGISLFYIEMILQAIKNEEYLLIKAKGKSSKIIPYLLDLENGYYYLYYAYEESDKIYHLRLDNIKELNYSSLKHHKPMRYDECRKLISESYNAYSTEDLMEVKLKVYDLDSYIIDDLKDSFDNVIINKDIVALKVRISDVFFSKIFSYADKVKIIAPVSAIERFKLYLSKVLDIYTR